MIHFLLDYWGLRKEHLYGDAGHSLAIFCSALLGCVIDGGGGAKHTLPPHTSPLPPPPAHHTRAITCYYLNLREGVTLTLQYKAAHIFA